MWPTVSPDSGTTKGFNLILLDDDNAHLHSFSYADVRRVIGKEVVGGGVYIVQNFMVRDAVGNLKPVSSDIYIRFTNASTFEACADDLIIPMYKFEFFNLGDILIEASKLAENENPEFAIDVIRVVEDYEEVKKIQTKFGEIDIVRFTICDGSIRHKVGVWGDLAVATHREYINDAVQISSLPSTKVYFNLNNESVTKMRLRLEEEGYKPLAKVDSDLGTELTIVSPFWKLSLQELNENINEKLELKVFMVAKRFKCDKCSRSMLFPDKRFRIRVNAKDPTFSYTIVLIDRVVKWLIGINASKLYKDHTKDERAARVFPALLDNMSGKEITAIIEVIKGKKDEDGFLIYAKDIYDLSAPTTSTIESPPDPQYPSTDLTESTDNAGTVKTPGSAKSVNKKIKMEK